MAKDIYYPEEIKDNDIGSIDQSTTTNESTKTVIVPETLKDANIPKKIVAYATISESLDTLAKKIKSTFSFSKLGGLQIGEYVNGVSGQILISPNGIVALDDTGDETVSIDALTGDAVFKGTVMASDFIIADENGLNSLNNFYSDKASGGAFNTTSTTYVDVTSGALSSLVLERETKVFIYIASIGYNSELSESPPYFGDLAVYDSFISGRIQYLTVPFCGIEAVAFNGDGTYKNITYMGQPIFIGMQITLAAGTHNLKLQMKSRGGTSYISGFELGLIQLGS